MKIHTGASGDLSNHVDFNVGLNGDKINRKIGIELDLNKHLISYDRMESWKF